MAIANAQYTMFDSSQIDLNTNSCIMDWVILALSPVGKYTFIKFTAWAHFLCPSFYISWKTKLGRFNGETSKEVGIIEAI